MLKTPRNKKVLKWSLLIGGILLLTGVTAFIYFQTLTYDDTAAVKVDYTVEAIPFIKEFEKDSKSANDKYSEKIIAVKGFVTATLPADTTINIEMKDTTTGSYIIFVFQQQHLDEAKKINPGDEVTIKGSCSGGIYSEILGSNFISFKRSTIKQ